MPDLSNRRTRYRVAQTPGWGYNVWVVQYWDRYVGVWFDMGDPCESEMSAVDKMRSYESEVA